MNLGRSFPFLLQWPTLPTLVMFPVLASIHRRLAIREEAEIAGPFGEASVRYRDATPRFIPRLRHPSPALTNRP